MFNFNNINNDDNNNNSKNLPLATSTNDKVDSVGAKLTMPKTDNTASSGKVLLKRSLSYDMASTSIKEADNNNEPLSSSEERWNKQIKEKNKISRMKYKKKQQPNKKKSNAKNDGKGWLNYVLCRSDEKNNSDEEEEYYNSFTEDLKSENEGDDSYENFLLVNKPIHKIQRITSYTPTCENNVGLNALPTMPSINRIQSYQGELDDVLLDINTPKTAYNNAEHYFKSCSNEIIEHR